MASIVIKPGVITRCLTSTRIANIRHHSKQNIKNPRPHQFPRASLEETCKPVLPRNNLPMSLLCKKSEEDSYRYVPDHPFEIVLGKTFRKSIQTSKFLAVCHFGIHKSADAYEVKKAFVKQKMNYCRYPMVVLRTALETTPFEGMTRFLIGNWMDCLVWGEEINIASFLKTEKKFSDVILLAAAVNNVVMTKKQLMEYSKMPPVEVFHSQLSMLLNQYSSQLVNTLNHHQTDLVTSLASYADDKKSSSS